MIKFDKNEFLKPQIYSTLDGYETRCNVTKEIVDDVKQLQQENQKYKEVIDKAIEFTNKKWGTWCTHHLEYMTELQNILKEVSE